MKAVFPAFDGFAPADRRAAGRDGIAAKRVLDSCSAGLLLVLLPPVLALVSLAVALDSPGPVLFCQSRTGLNGKTFADFQIPLHARLEDGADVRQAVEGDARITRVGRIIRKFSLDELPQLFNVLAGEMSLVGPRPHAVAHDDLLWRRASPITRVRHPGQAGHHRLGPGEWRARRHAHHRRSCRTASIWTPGMSPHASLALDLKILARTPLEVLRTRNAV